MADRLNAILFALPQEATPFLKDFPGRKCLHLDSLKAWSLSPEWLAVCTGMGPRVAHRSLDLVARAFPSLNAVISAGFCGSLADHLQIGQAVLVQRIFSDSEGRWIPFLPEPQLPQAILFTSEVPALTLIERLAIREKTGADIVDMESAIVARWCQSRNVGFMGLRVVSDDCDNPLPSFVSSLCGDEGIRYSKLAQILIRNPLAIRDLIRMARNSRRAALELARQLKALTERLSKSSPWINGESIPRAEPRPPNG